MGFAQANVCQRLNVQRHRYQTWVKLLPAHERPRRDVSPGEELALWVIKYVLDDGRTLENLKPYARNLFGICADPPLYNLPHDMLRFYRPDQVAFCSSDDRSEPYHFEVPIRKLARRLILATSYKADSIWLQGDDKKAEKRKYIESLCRKARLSAAPDEVPDIDPTVLGAEEASAVQSTENVRRKRGVSTH